MKLRSLWMRRGWRTSGRRGATSACSPSPGWSSPTTGTPWPARRSTSCSFSGQGGRSGGKSKTKIKYFHYFSREIKGNILLVWYILKWGNNKPGRTWPWVPSPWSGEGTRRSGEERGGGTVSWYYRNGDSQSCLFFHKSDVEIVKYLTLMYL